MVCTVASKMQKKPYQNKVSISIYSTGDEKIYSAEKVQKV